MKFELIEEKNLYSTFGITDGLTETEMTMIGGDWCINNVNICINLICVNQVTVPTPAPAPSCSTKGY